ncbi:MAG: LAGLIDADG family homing endonuclease, partial [Haloglomus sp.]
MSAETPDVEADEVTLPVKRTEGDTLEERLTGNAYHNILPARYLKKDADGNFVEEQEDLFPRVARNIALAEAVFEAERRDLEITVTPDLLKPDHPRRDELAAEVFGEGVAADDDDAETTLDASNVNKFAYETLVPELPDEVREHVEATADEFQELMEQLSFIPNSPTLMNAGDELQQLSACFVDSPDDDLTDIHQTAKEAAEVFQCLTADASVRVDGEGTVSIADVEPGDEIVQRFRDGYRTKRVEEVHAYDDAPTRRLETESGIEIRGTPNHRLLVNGDWTELEDVSEGDTVSVRLGWLADEDRTVSLETIPSGAGWADARTVSNEAIASLHAEGLSDYEIADRLDSSPSTVQRRRSDELGLSPNGQGGRQKGRTFDEGTFESLYDEGHTDSEIADELGVSPATVGSLRRARGKETNGQPVKTVTQPETLGEDLAELVGLWIGDGSVHQDGIRFHVSRESVLETLDRRARDLFDTGVDWTWSDGCYEAVIHSHEIKRWWLANFGDAKPSSADARVPAPVQRGDRSIAAGFLRGLFTADGSLTQEKYPRLYSASEELIDDVNQLLLGVGIPATKWDWTNEDRDYFSVAPVGSEGLAPFAETVGFLDDRTETLQVELAETETRPISIGRVDGSTWEQSVAAIEDADEATVYDVTVADDAEYVANGLVSHNSGGGMGYAFWQLRPYGDPVGSTGGIASGPMTFMETFDQMCFPPGTEVLTPEGQRAIEDLREGDLVIDENGTEQPVAETMERHVDEELVEVVPERLNEPIRATGEHPFKVVRNDGFEWVDARDLCEDDQLVLGHAATENELTLDATLDLRSVASGPMAFTDGGAVINREYYGTSKGPTPASIETEIPMADFATVAGWYLAEGCVVYRRGTPNEVTFTLHADETDEADEIRAALDGFGIEPRIETVEGRNTLHVHVESASFAQLIEGLFGTGASEKRVPEFLWDAPVETQARVIEALFDGDGTLEKRGESQRVQLQLVCEEIVDWVFQAGLRCGVQFSRHTRTPEDRQPTHWVSASVSTALGTPLECLFDAVPDDFRAVDRTKQANGHEVVPIDTVECVPYEGPVYNAEVADTHTYVAEDVVVHNCETIAQGGARRGAQMGVMRVSHPDVIEFLHAKNKDVSLAHTLRLNDPDDYTHTDFSEALAEARELIDDEGRVPKHLRNAVEGHLSNFNISVGITDEFMSALRNGEEFTFTNPRTGEPHIATEETKEMYARYGLGEHVTPGEEFSIDPELIWDRIVEGAHENGEPGVIYLERVNKQHSFDVEEHPDHRILATNPCLTADMRVQLADGSTEPIGEIAAGDVSVDVQTLDGGEVDIRPARAFKTKQDTDILRVTTESGLSIRVTPDHRIRTTDDGWVEAQYLSAGTELVGLSEVRATPQGPVQETSVETVAQVEADGSEDVYDLTVEGTHNFFVSESGEQSINVHNCGEQPLEEYEACNLGHINLSTLAAHEAPDWRVFKNNRPDDENLEDSVEAFLEQSLDIDEFERRIELGTRFLENVVTMSDFPVPEIEEKVREMRKIGLGIMGLAQLYIQLGVRYGSEEANEIARQVMMKINHDSKWASHELAQERGSFDEWDKSKYANPTEYPDWFEHHTGLDADEWADGFPIRNHNTTTIAPTGTTSMVGNTTGGCEPIYNVAYYKNVSD